MALLNHQRPLWALLAAAPLIATVSSSVYAQTWKINLRDADLTAFINEVADITGKNFAVDPRVRGNVTVISNKPLNKNEVYDLFLGVLNVNGVVAIPSGNTIKLVPDSNVKIFRCSRSTHCLQLSNNFFSLARLKAYCLNIILTSTI